MELERFVPIEELAKHFSVSISTVRGWLRQGHIPNDTYLKIGNTYRFSLPKVVEALTAKNTSRSSPDSRSQKKDDAQLELDFTNPDEDA